MNTIEIQLDDVINNLSERLTEPFRFEESSQYLNKLKDTLIDSNDSRKKQLAISKAFWDGHVPSLIPDRFLMQMEYYKSEWELFKLRIISEKECFDFYSKDLIF